MDEVIEIVEPPIDPRFIPAPYEGNPELLKHEGGGHDQSSHGNWASGVGDYDEVEAQIKPIMDKWREKSKELDAYLESKGLTMAYSQIQSDAKAKRLWDEKEALWEKQSEIREKFKDEHFSPKPETEEYQRLRDKYVVADTPTLNMNRQLRGSQPRITERVRDADALCAMGTIKKEVGVYRGAVLPAEMLDTLQVGKTFIDKGFQSTDLSQSSAKFYAETRLENGAQGELTLLRMTLKPGLNAVDVSYGEIVVQRNAQMTVTGKTKTGEYTIIDVEVTK